MGLLSFIFLFSLTKDIAILFNLTIEHEWVLGASILFGLVATKNALKKPIIKNIKVEIENLPQELCGLKIAHISDLHIGPSIGKNYVENVVNAVNDIKPDLIALTGDIGDGPVKEHREAIVPIGKLKSKLGVFYVPGNHEYYWDANEWMNALNNLKVIVLVNRGKILHYNNRNILICGVPDPVSRLELDVITPLQIEASAPLKILLSHRPNLSIIASQNGYDLQLSGHTHGGQFFPWTIFVKLFHKNVAGLYKINKMWLNVNPGTGSWGPMMRLGTRTEISLIEINSPHQVHNSLVKNL
jgi:predicted MPP superfamily phosphohydrolase